MFCWGMAANLPDLKAGQSTRGCHVINLIEVLRSIHTILNYNTDLNKVKGINAPL